MMCVWLQAEEQTRKNDKEAGKTIALVFVPQNTRIRSKNKGRKMKRKLQKTRL